MTKVYKYGLLPPVEGAEIVAQQLDLAWRSACARVAIEQAYREDRAVIYREHGPTVAAIGVLNDLRQDARARLATLHTSKKAPMTPEARAIRGEIRSLGEQIKALRPQATKEREAIREQGLLVELDNRRNEALLDQCREWSKAGLFWGNRQLIADAHVQRIKSWKDLRAPSSWDLVGGQIMGGMPTETFVNGGDGRLALSEPRPVPGRGRDGRGRPLPMVTVRIGRDDSTATWPVILHRPLPENGSIRNVRVCRKTVGRNTRWHLLLAVTVPDPEPVSCEGPVVAVCPAPGGLSGKSAVIAAAMWVDTQDKAGAYVLQPKLVSRLQHVIDHQAVRDKRRDVLIGKLRDWIAKNGRPESWPPSLLLWESCNRWRAFVAAWGQHRMANDAEVYADAEAWAMQDRHLWDWMAHDSARGLARRMNDYRVWAASLADEYGGIVVPDTDYAEAKRQKSKSERKQTTHKEARTRDVVSPGMLRTVLQEAFTSRGKPVWRVPGTTAAGLLCEWRMTTPEPVDARTKKSFRFNKKEKEGVSEDCEMAGMTDPLANGQLSCSGTGG